MGVLDVRGQNVHLQLAAARFGHCGAQLSGDGLLSPSLRILGEARGQIEELIDVVQGRTG